MNRSFTRQFNSTSLFLAATLVVLIGSAFILRENFSSVSDQERWVRHTSSVLSELEIYISSLKDAETDQRGYILTKNDSFLGSYRKAVLETGIHAQRLKNLLKDNPAHTEKFMEVERLAGQRLALLEKNLGLGLEGAEKRRNAFSLGEGKSLMDDIRRRVEELKTLETGLLEQRTADVRESKSIFWKTLWITTLFTAFIIIISFFQFRRVQNRILQETDKEAKEAWIQSQMAELGILLSGDLSLEEMSQKTLAFLCEKFDFLAANFYLAENDSLKLISSQGLSEGDKDLLKSKRNVSRDEGLLAQTIAHRKTFYLEEVPANYFKIGSSLGEALPKTLLIMPLYFQRRIMGIIELAAFDQVSALNQEALDKMRETIGIGVNASISRENLQSLLEKTQQQSEELQAQQEELQAQQEELRTSNEELEQQTRALESQQQVLNMRNQELLDAKSLAEQRAKELERTNQYKSEFLAKMSHELRTPLNSLLILASLLIENKEKNLTDQQREFSKSIYNAGQDLLSLINDILDLSKIEARKLHMRPEPFTVQSLVEHMRLTFQPMTKSKNLDLQIDVPEKTRGLTLFTDRQRLEQILRNFLSNAVKFTERGQVSLKIESLPHGKIAFHVEDTGVGIPQEKQNLIFEAFEQADGSVSRKYGGTGLGLTISKELASLLGGTISLRSIESEGSRFTIEIPQNLPNVPAPAPGGAFSSPALEAKPELPAEDNGAKPSGEMSPEVRQLLKELPPDAKTILIVEDDDVFRRSVAEATTSYGFHPIEVADGESALEILKSHSPSALLLDIKLPGISGLGLLEMIKQMPHLRHIPIHMISALEYQQNAMRLGAMGYLGKPVTIDKIRSALDRIENLVSRKVRRLLIIEDDNTQRQAIKELIAGEDIEIQTAQTGKESLRKIQETGFDCIILDLSLPDISGFDLLDQMNSLDISLPPIVIYTGRDLSRKEEEFLRRYSESIIIKGAKSPDRLLDEVNLFLHRVETLMPAEKQKMLNDLRSQDSAFEGKNVLIVDDDLRNIFALTSVLEGKGLNVRIARDGFEALETLEKHNDIDVVLMDIMMPRMDGFECMRRIRKMEPFKHLPIVALTAKAMKEDHEKCIEAGANDYLQKPINISNLMSVLKVWMAPKGLFV